MPRNENTEMHLTCFVDSLQQLLKRYFNPTALLRLRDSADKVFAELKEMKEEAAHTQSGVTIHEFFKKHSYRQPIIIVLVVNLGSQLSGFNAVSHEINCLCSFTEGKGSTSVLLTNILWLLLNLKLIFMNLETKFNN